MALKPSLLVGNRNRRSPPEADLQAKLDAARTRLHEVVILRMKTWLPEDTRQGLREAEASRREQIRVHFRILEHSRTAARSPPS